MASRALPRAAGRLPPASKSFPLIRSTGTPFNCSRRSCGSGGRIQKLIALLRVLLVVLKISRFALDQTRLSDRSDKRSLLRVIDRSRSALPLRSVLRIIRLSPSRYHHWNRAQQCPLDERPSCP